MLENSENPGFHFNESCDFTIAIFSIPNYFFKFYLLKLSHSIASKCKVNILNYPFYNTMLVVLINIFLLYFQLRKSSQSHLPTKQTVHQSSSYPILGIAVTEP